MLKMTHDFVSGIFESVGFKVLRIVELTDQYEPQRGWPWWYIKTQFGYILFGPRHRVISIDWGDTNLREIISQDDVTKDKEIIHAWTMGKVLEYLEQLYNKLLNVRVEEAKVNNVNKC